MKPNTLGDLFKTIIVNYIVVKIRKRSLDHWRGNLVKEVAIEKKLWKKKEANHTEKFVIWYLFTLSLNTWGLGTKKSNSEWKVRLV